MPLYTGRGKPESLLTRRVQRHAHLATLFSGQTGLGDERGVLRAQARPIPNTFTGSVVQASLAAGRPDFFDNAEQAGLLEEGLSSPTTVETRLPAQPAAPESASAGTDDPSWRRLEAISKAHREKAEPSPVSTGPASRPQERPAGQKPTPQRTAPPATRPAPAIQRQPQPPPDQALPRLEPKAAKTEGRTQASGTGLNDDDWRRLEAISNAHRRKEQSKGVSQASQGSPAPIQSSTAEPTAQAAPQETERPIRADAQTQVQPATSTVPENLHPLQLAENPSIQLKPETANKNTGNLIPAKIQKPSIMQRIRGLLARSPVADETQAHIILPQEQGLAARLVAPVHPAPDQLPEKPAAQETWIQAKRAEEKTAAAGPQPEMTPENPIIERKPAVQRVAEQLSKDETAQDFNNPLDEEQEISSEETLPAQAQPLQEAWNVERQNLNRNENPLPTSAPESLDGATLEAIHPQQAVIQRLLDQVRSGQPSDSKVETLPPRKPRPGMQFAAQSGEIAQKFEANIQPLQSASEPPAGISPEGFLAPASADFPAPDTFSAPAVTSTEPPAVDENREEMVETPAGILPASLANLLQGQRPGAPILALDETTIQKQPMPGIPLMPVAQCVVQRSPEISDTRSETPLPGIEPQTDVVQRTVDISEVAVEPNRGQSGEQTVQPEVIEELARKVYAEVKRKMAVERERNRH